MTACTACGYLIDGSSPVTGGCTECGARYNRRELNLFARAAPGSRRSLIAIGFYTMYAVSLAITWSNWTAADRALAVACGAVAILARWTVSVFRTQKPGPLRVRFSEQGCAVYEHGGLADELMVAWCDWSWSDGLRVTPMAGGGSAAVDRAR